MQSVTERETEKKRLQSGAPKLNLDVLQPGDIAAAAAAAGLQPGKQPPVGSCSTCVQIALCFADDNE